MAVTDPSSTDTNTPGAGSRTPGLGVVLLGAEAWHHEAMKTLLVIDDDEKLVGLVRDYLEPHGFRIQAAHEGPAGVSAVARSRPDLVILDIMLPGMDGFEVCRRIREDSAVPILMLTARGEDTDRIVGLELGADDYLPKPFNPRELLARIRAILRRADGASEQGAAGVVVVGTVRLDPGDRSVHVGGEPIDLTTAEFDLLHVLIASAGRVLSRDQLMQQIHGTGWAAYDRSIDVHVSRIRSKLGDDSRRPAMLKTVRGVGYQFARPEGDR
jgi:DNA-binding response OmpR family regulator